MNPLFVALSGIVPGLGTQLPAVMAAAGWLVVEFDQPPAPLFLIAMTYYSSLLANSSTARLIKTAGGSHLSATTAGEVFIVEANHTTALHDSN